MAKAIVIPKMNDVEPDYIILSHWLKKTGSFVKLNDPLVEVESDKAVLEIKSELEGTLLYKVAQEDDKLVEGKLIGIIGEAHEKFEDYKSILAEHGALEVAAPPARETKLHETESVQTTTIYTPQHGQGGFIASNATVVGKVTLGNQVSVWYQAVLRADEDQIVVGDRTNIQDGCIIHCDEGKPTTIGQSVTVGHGAIVHGASVDDFSLIGMRATVLNGAQIGKYCVIGANALITENMVVPDYSVVMGTPGKVVKQLPESYKATLEKAASIYVHLSEEHIKGIYKAL
ncbi:biotin/lipoyl-containing protein [Microscilla marina]|uniref:Bacterial transferase family protein n=1 Tax=Microscilla marina ATCC 23134 TaxID=313606 RepID=A1ZWM2_MICM2|nr:biotin/lipoyl-containing protein [Microscilla marina]EAY25262.1 bacterial transferase family protein [Microscilla marina ATCC 23134]